MFIYICTMKKENEDTCVYFHINPSNNLIFYVGIGSLKRAYLKNNRNKWWKNIVNKYGYDIYVIHENLSWKEACEKEKAYIKTFGRQDLDLGPLVNLTDGGEGIKNLTLESKQKISVAAKNRVMSKEQKQKLSKAHKGKKQSSEHINKRSSQLKGRKYSEKHRENISKSLIGKIVSENTKKKHKDRMLGIKHSTERKVKMSLSSKNKNAKPILQLNLDNEFIQEWLSGKEIERKLKISSTSICNCLKGITKTAGKFKWKYK